ncbi:hypothetical protein P9112_008065 [Eukaryota sp. TZLM1-RC]
MRFVPYYTNLVSFIFWIWILSPNKFSFKTAGLVLYNSISNDFSPKARAPFVLSVMYDIEPTEVEASYLEDEFENDPSIPSTSALSRHYSSDEFEDVTENHLSETVSVETNDFRARSSNSFPESPTISPVPSHIPSRLSIASTVQPSPQSPQDDSPYQPSWLGNDSDDDFIDGSQLTSRGRRPHLLSRYEKIPSRLNKRKFLFQSLTPSTVKSSRSLLSKPGGGNSTVTKNRKGQQLRRPPWNSRFGVLPAQKYDSLFDPYNHFAVSDTCQNVIKKTRLPEMNAVELKVLSDRIEESKKKSVVTFDHVFDHVSNGVIRSEKIRSLPESAIKVLNSDDNNVTYQDRCVAFGALLVRLKNLWTEINAPSKYSSFSSILVDNERSIENIKNLAGECQRLELIRSMVVKICRQVLSLNYTKNIQDKRIIRVSISASVVSLSKLAPWIEEFYVGGTNYADPNQCSPKPKFAKFLSETTNTSEQYNVTPMFQEPVRIKVGSIRSKKRVS